MTIVISFEFYPLLCPKPQKLLVALAALIVLCFVLVCVNGVTTFFQGFLQSYILWLIVDWWDCFVIDWVFFCHDKRLRIPGTEDLAPCYEDYLFHAKGSLMGMVIGLPVSLLAGGLTALIAAIL